MASPFSKGVQAADKAFELFEGNDMLAGSAGYSAADTIVAVAHGLSAAPDWCILGFEGVIAGSAEGVMWSATATTLTITIADTTDACTVSYLAGRLV